MNGSDGHEKTSKASIIQYIQPIKDITKQRINITMFKTDKKYFPEYL